MLTITVPGNELFNEETQQFERTAAVVLELEHSLVSISKWESSWEKPFLGDKERTDEEAIDYIRCMVLNDISDPSVFSRLTNENIKQINEYITAKRSATWFNENGKQAKSREVVTSELIYHWMVALTIPFECQHWHLSRLLTLIKVCNQKSTPPKKMSRAEALAKQRELNAQRRAMMQTSG